MIKMKKTYKERLKLRKETKVVLTVLITLISYIIYLKAQKWGIHTGNLIDMTKCTLAWIWLIMGQVSTLILIWEEN